jgi:sugar-specific transcriptional regulator TrmB
VDAPNELKELGLDNNEIQVYMACLMDQGLNVKQIAQRTQLIRTTVYGVLNTLKQKGLVSTLSKEGIMIFRSASPKELLNILDQKKTKIESIIPKLIKMQEFKKESYKMEVFEGKNGIKTITNDLLSRPNEPVKVMGIGKKWLEFSDIFTSIYYRKKKEMNVHTKTILADNKEERKFLSEKKFANSDIKFIKNIDFGNTVTYMYHDKVSFVLYDEENPRGFMIQDQAFNKIQTIFFERLWNQAKK